MAVSERAKTMRCNLMMSSLDGSVGSVSERAKPTGALQFSGWRRVFLYNEEGRVLMLKTAENLNTYYYSVQEMHLAEV